MLTVNELMQQLNRLPLMRHGKNYLGRKKKRGENELNWTKKRIFFELPYWTTLLLLHNLDIIHIKKNMFDNVFVTLMGIDKKDKDTTKARVDLELLGIKKELHLRDAIE